jgi:hypothetical protein
LETNNTENNEQATEQNEVVIEDPKAVLSALERAKADAKKFREQAEELEKTVGDKNNTIIQYGQTILNEKLSQKLLNEGIKDPERMIKFINKDEISLDDDLNLIGFEDQFEKLKADLPEVFDAKLRVGGQADAAVKASVSTQFSASEMQARKILGKI